jgi:hypothetical protein
MQRYIIDYDPSQSPAGGTEATAAIVSGLLDLRKKGRTILEARNPFTYPLVDQIVVNQGTIITLFNGEWKSFEVDKEIILGVGDLDTGTSFNVGNDYYIYLVDDNKNGKLVISANATFPQGTTANSTRKIGGFHFGHVRCVRPIHNGVVPVNSAGVIFGGGGGGITRWEMNVVVGIVWNSVWDLMNRPKCAPEGMVKVGNMWMDIYLSSPAEYFSFEPNLTGNMFIGQGKLQSKYGQLPASGDSGLSWYNFSELAVRSNKRLFTYSEWIQGAYGNPGGSSTENTYGTTSGGGTTRTGCQVESNGTFNPLSNMKRAAISAYNLVDCVGNLAELTSSLAASAHSSTSWLDVLGSGKGQARILGSDGVRSLSCGGMSIDGNRAGARTIDLTEFGGTLWSMRHERGCRLCCDKLVN